MGRLHQLYAPFAYDLKQTCFGYLTMILSFNAVLVVKLRHAALFSSECRQEDK
jgi:hypothetical protein